ncbi:MAG: MFS transporter [Elusimicrobia bacterium]|nr:MFS transporter [Elusimicrobiota bacterium]
MDYPRHAFDYRLRRALNWVPMGLAYAFLYMGRYNLTVAKSALGDALMTKAQFGTIFAVGAWVYGVSFLASGPLTDKLGGRNAMLVGTGGALIVNAVMGLALYGMGNWGWNISLFWMFMVLYAINMHFQSYGAVAIVTVKAPWFHVRERGTGFAIVEATRAALPEKLGVWASIAHFFLPSGTGMNQNWWLFFVPAALLGVTWIIMWRYLCDSPGEAGYKDFDTGEEALSHDGKRLPVMQVFKKIVTHPVLIVVCGIEFCSGILRNGIMHWYPLFAAEVGFKKTFWVVQNWGMVLFLAGVAGSILTGWASDRLFQSRRAPMAGVLYGLMAICAVVLAFTLDQALWWAGAAVILMSMAVIGVHGILSGTSTTDFGGAKNAGAAVGIVDGMVYLGTGLQSVIIGSITPTGDAAKIASNWFWWPVFLVPFSLIGLALAVKIWHAVPKKRQAPVAQLLKGKDPELQP